MSGCQSPESNISDKEWNEMCENAKPISQMVQCTCKCYVSQNGHKFRCVICNPVFEETITIKKALWDEMLEYKKKIDELNTYLGAIDHLVSAGLISRVSNLEHHEQIHEKRIENLEKLEGERQGGFETQTKRIMMLETHKNYQIDENRKESKIIDRLKENIYELQERTRLVEKTVSELVDKIAAIGNYCYADKKPHRCPVCMGTQRDYDALENNRNEDLLSIQSEWANELGRLEARFRELERFQDITHEQYKNIISNKKPHTCPLCNGSTYSKEGMMCVPCGGSGIVWN